MVHLREAHTGDGRDARAPRAGTGETTLFKYKLHQQQDLFDRAYAYIEQYY